MTLHNMHHNKIASSGTPTYTRILKQLKLLIDHFGNMCLQLSFENTRRFTVSEGDWQETQ